MKIGKLLPFLSPVTAIPSAIKQVKDRGVRGTLDQYYGLSPQQYAMNQSEQAAIRAEQREKEFYDPKAQMKRLTDAGLNPHLVYGGGVSGASGSFTSRQPGPMNAPKGIGESVLSAIQLGAMISNVASQGALRATQAGVNAARVPEIQAKTDLMKQAYNQLDYINPGLAAKVYSEAQQAFQGEELSKTENDIAKAKLNNLLMQYNIMTKDKEIRQEILRGKSIVNDIDQMERDWLKEGEFTAQKFWELLLLTLSKKL